MTNEVFEIVGGNKLNGTIKVQTSKNAVLPILAATIITPGVFKILDCPNIVDVNNMITILETFGAKVEKDTTGYIIDTKNIDITKLDCELCKTMRSSLFLLGSMLARCGRAIITEPGGCKIGARPIDIHLKSLKHLGVKITEVEDKIYFDSSKAHAGKVKLKLPSVGATENLVEFACKLKGKTTIYNAAKEPEVVDLCNFLNKMGAKIVGAGTTKITIYGVDNLTPVIYTPISDRIVAGTIMCGVAICGGNVVLTNAVAEHNLNLIDKLKSMGCVITYNNTTIHIVSNKKLTSVGEISTGYFPDFPTDEQSLMFVTSCLAKGQTEIKENIFENRFLTLPELKKMGANVLQKDKNSVTIIGVGELSATKLTALDLRGGASLVLAGLVAKGKTTVENIAYIDRGYEKLENMFASLGANIKRV